MNQLHVAKFGGTSMADVSAMSQSADIVLRDPNIALVVVSACAGVTNLLVELSDGELPSDSRQQRLTTIYRRHRMLLEDMSASVQATQAIEDLLVKLYAAVQRQSSQRSDVLSDEILSFGERLSCCLFTELLNQKGRRAECFDARQVMRTDSHFGNATPNVGVIAELANRELLPRCSQSLVVTQGFVGADESGRTTTLGRGGSDYSAALLAEALGADALQVWTDVEGIYTTDPRIATSAYAIDEISFDEAAELSTFGAKVLHPSTLLPAIRQNISVFVGSTFNPAAGGTWVRQSVESGIDYRAIAARNNQTLVTVSSLDMLHRHGFLAQVFAILARHKVGVDLVTTSEVSVALTLDNVGSKQAELPSGALNELSTICDVSVEKDLALVAIVGNDLDRRAGVSARIFTLLAPYNLRLICHGASSHNICFLVSQRESNDIVCALHRELFEQGDPQ